MLLLMEHNGGPGSGVTDTVLKGGVLHDTLEDNPEEVTVEILGERFGNTVATIVSNVTLDPENNDKGLSRKHILSCDGATRIVKVADILSNTLELTKEIARFGVTHVQQFFSQPFLERIEMESAFLKDVGLGCESFPGLMHIRTRAVHAVHHLRTSL